MFNQSILDFFKRHNLYEENMFEYIYDHCDMIDYYVDEDARICIGCSYAIDKKTKKLLRFRICIPYPIDDKTMLMAIHEIVHGIVGYKFLGRRFDLGIAVEALPMLYERIYVSEHPTEELIAFANKLDNTIKPYSDPSYRFGYLVRHELYNKYEPNYHKMDKLVRKMAKDFERKEKQN